MVRNKILIILTVFLILCTGHTKAQKEIFVKLIEFRLDQVSEKDYENEYFMTIKFNKGSTYKIKVTNHLEEDLDKLRDVVEQTFEGSQQEIEQQKKSQSKALQYEGYNKRRSK